MDEQKKDKPVSFEKALEEGWHLERDESPFWHTVTKRNDTKRSIKFLRFCRMTRKTGNICGKCISNKNKMQQHSEAKTLHQTENLAKMNSDTVSVKKTFIESNDNQDSIRVGPSRSVIKKKQPRIVDNAQDINKQMVYCNSERDRRIEYIPRVGEYVGIIRETIDSINLQKKETLSFLLVDSFDLSSQTVSGRFIKNLMGYVYEVPPNDLPEIREDVHQCNVLGRAVFNKISSPEANLVYFDLNSHINADPIRHYQDKATNAIDLIMWTSILPGLLDHTSSSKTDIICHSSLPPSRVMSCILGSVLFWLRHRCTGVQYILKGAEDLYYLFWSDILIRNKNLPSFDEMAVLIQDTTIVELDAKDIPFPLITESLPISYWQNLRPMGKTSLNKIIEWLEENQFIKSVYCNEKNQSQPKSYQIVVGRPPTNFRLDNTKRVTKKRKRRRDKDSDGDCDDDMVEIDHE